MKISVVLAIVICVLYNTLPVAAALSPQEVVVVYNTDLLWSPISQTVADYYCASRGIPSANKIGLSIPVTGELISPSDFLTFVLNDQGTQPGLRSFLQSLGSDPDDPSTDPIKAIVLCYGVPSRIEGNERASSLDSALTLLFNTTPWGQEPIGGYSGYVRIVNPYFVSNDSNPLDRRGRPGDFGEFRASSYNDSDQSPPSFTIVRMLDDSHALAGGRGGILYSGVRTGDTWDWTEVTDSEKSFIAYNVNDISVLDSQHAWVCTEGGTLIQTNDGGQSWIHLQSAWTDYVVSSPVKSASFFSAQDGWVVGKTGTWTGSVTVFTPYLYRYSSSGTSRCDLPTNFVPESVASLGIDSAWVSGDSGIFYTPNRGVNWYHQYSAGAVKRIFVKNGEGWALTSAGSIMRTANPQSLNPGNWSVDSNAPTGVVDLSVFDSTHIAAAFGSSVCVYDGTTWTTANLGSGCSSGAWAGDHVLAADTFGSTIRASQGLPGTPSWQISHTTPAAHWKMRYLVCRLDGYSSPVDAESGMPADVKALIDRAVTADDNGRGESTNARFVLDDSSTPPGHPSRLFSSGLITCLSGLVGSSNVNHETDLGKYVTDESNLIGYSSSGSYDGAAHNFTTWWSPHSDWKPGGIGVYWMVSHEGRTFRAPAFIGSVRPGGAVAAGKLKVSDTRLTNLYDGHWVGLYKGNTPLTNPVQLARANFNSGTATIDLSAVDWQDDTNCYIEVHFPDDDPDHSQSGIGEMIVRTSLGPAVYNARYTGISYDCSYFQCLASELIRDGCSGVTGNVREPWPDSCPKPEYILPHYASGRTWAESAYMGLFNLAWMEVVVGDPLMSPFKKKPTVEFNGPTPSDGSHVYGKVTLHVNAVPDGDGAIERVEFWAVADAQAPRLMAADHAAPFECVWDTSAYANGDYSIQVVACQSGTVVGSSEVTRSLTVDNTVDEVSIRYPSGDDTVINASTPVQAETSGDPSRVQFWLIGCNDPILAGEDYYTSPYECSIPSSVANGVYDLQAVAVYDGSPLSAYYSERRRITVLNDVPILTTVSALAEQVDGAQLFMSGVTVAAGTSPAMNGALYIEDSDRATGIRVATSQAVDSGRSVVVSGTLHKNGTGVTERYIDAYQVYDLGPAAGVPQPLGMPNLGVGGQAPADTVGVTDGVGLYNTGLLVRTWGRVTYVGDDFVYIDDGSGRHDGNGIDGPVVVPLDGSAFREENGNLIHRPVTGIKVHFGSLKKPGIDDYVSIAGMSSLEQIGGNIVSVIRLRDSADLRYGDQYINAHITMSGWLAGIEDDLPIISSDPTSPDHKAKLCDCVVSAVYTDRFVIHSPDTPHFLIDVLSPLPRLQVGDTVTVTGPYLGADIYDDHAQVSPTSVYYEGSAYGALRAGTFSQNTVSGVWGGGTYRPWPYPTAEEILQSPWFQHKYNQVGAIGWAISQPDGTVVDLPAVQVVYEWYDGQVLGLREMFEPLQNAPKLLVYLDKPVKRLSDKMTAVDIVGGVMTTLSDGRRAITRPKAVYAYTDQEGNYMLAFPWDKDTSAVSTIGGRGVDWAWKKLIAP